MSDARPGNMVWRGIVGLCPRCGVGKLFCGFVRLAPGCRHCKLDYGFADAGDGPAVFVTLIGGAAVLGFALWLEFTVDPPIWVHILVSLPMALIICLGMLRPLKGILVARQFEMRAEEGRLDR